MQRLCPRAHLDESNCAFRSSLIHWSKKFVQGYKASQGKSQRPALQNAPKDKHGYNGLPEGNVFPDITEVLTVANEHAENHANAIHPTICAQIFTMAISGAPMFPSRKKIGLYLDFVQRGGGSYLNPNCYPVRHYKLPRHPKRGCPLDLPMLSKFNLICLQPGWLRQPRKKIFDSAYRISKTRNIEVVTQLSRPTLKFTQSKMQTQATYLTGH